MPTHTASIDKTLAFLSKDYIANFPYKSVRFIENLPSKEAAALLNSQPSSAVINLWRYIPAGIAEKIFACLSDDMAIAVLLGVDSHIAVALLSRLSEEKAQHYMSVFEHLHQNEAREYRELLTYPERTAARMMTTNIICFYDDTDVRVALQKLRQRDHKAEEVIYIINEQQTLLGEIPLSELVISRLDAKLATLCKPVKSVFNALDSDEMVIERFEGHRCSAMPVVDAHGQLIGSIRFFDIYQSTKEDLATDMQTMVGVSKEERALSSSLFAVKKRLPWLQINLLTAFAAAAVVGAFEGLISEITALAILLPVAAGQSGNAGAQALAVTMRGLTLREITTRHLNQVIIKEFFAGILNGIAIAITCSIAVYFWSGSIGLSLVIALAMISSLGIACTAGAIVPIALKKFGLDPAQSSSIVLTTITDIAGFMSFLGIALLLSDMLPRG